MLIAICDDEKEVRDLLAGKIKKLSSPGQISVFMQAGKNCYWPGSSRIFCFWIFRCPEKLVWKLPDSCDDVAVTS